MAKVTIYTTPACGFCRAALHLLNQKGVPFENINVAGDETKRAWLRETTGQFTVPQVFINDEPYGGYTDIAALDAEGKLDALLDVAASG